MINNRSKIMATSTPTNRSNAIHLLVFLLLLPFAAAGKCNKDDKRALLAIKSAFNNAYHFASWTNTSACCDWYGIECDPGIAKGRVTGLFVLTDSNVTGPIPAAVGDLPYLTSLSFHKLPNVVGSIPFSITRLTRLSVLLLSWNSLSGPIPAFLSQVPSLITIDLSFNHFSGSIPPELSLLTKLLGIDLSRNRLTDSIPASFGSFPKSSPPSLTLSHNNLSGNLPPELGVPAWGAIDFSRNMLTGDASILFGAGKPTTQLDLSRNLFSFDLSRVTFPVNLTNLDLNHNKITGSIPAQINELKVNTLVGFNVSYNQLCGKIPAGPITAKFGPDAFFHNKCLCGSPLPACVKS
ncbi:Polygalacturonase inhibitor 1 [Apostasia shenzhenica]|uniref:Polygalacturonase inhibitor 1 n=1 Tax=Apostasia shenzhenica TaxID=1088818 RepID=A0A2I0A701_9ASPA|nr:Polygalacturonase inhibitor 1 [Apostasia shenzhenica]